MRGYLTESAPEVKQALVELATLRSQLAKAEKDEPAAVSGRLEDTYVERFREYKYKETLYEMFAKQYELARVDEAREGAVIQVIDPAQPPEKKSQPKKALIAIIATLAAGFALLLFVVVRQALAWPLQYGRHTWHPKAAPGAHTPHWRGRHRVGRAGRLGGGQARTVGHSGLHSAGGSAVLCLWAD
jgi:hypothetical protein